VPDNGVEEVDQERGEGVVSRIMLVELKEKHRFIWPVVAAIAHDILMQVEMARELRDVDQRVAIRVKVQQPRPCARFGKGNVWSLLLDPGYHRRRWKHRIEGRVESPGLRGKCKEPCLEVKNRVLYPQS
jgi:hypothetical protein